MRGSGAQKLYLPFSEKKHCIAHKLRKEWLPAQKPVTEVCPRTHLLEAAAARLERTPRPACVAARDSDRPCALQASVSKAIKWATGTPSGVHFAGTGPRPTASTAVTNCAHLGSPGPPRSRLGEAGDSVCPRHLRGGPVLANGELSWLSPLPAAPTGSPGTACRSPGPADGQAEARLRAGATLLGEGRHGCDTLPPRSHPKGDGHHQRRQVAPDGADGGPSLAS